MSHAANLRNRQHSNNLPQKRRKHSTDARPQVNGYHALSNGFKELKAIPTKDAKAYSANAKADETKVTVSRGDGDSELKATSTEAVEISSDDSSSDESSEEEEDERNQVPHKPNGVLDRIESSRNETEEPAIDGQKEGLDDFDQAQEEAPSFGDLIQAQGGETRYIDASADLDSLERKDLTQFPNRTLSVPSATSLGTVLSQALRTDDIDLLESCLQVPNLESIRATIERLHSSLAASLLQKLAERMHRRPGRAGSLMVWVQWTVVAHGGYLATQPAAMKQLQTLYQVVKQRATGLQPLLALKGKLDMLEAQLQLRRNRQAMAPRAEEVDEGIIYVEGEEEDSDAQQTTASISSKSRKRRLPSSSLGGDSEDDEEMPVLTNGVSDDEDEMDQEESDEDLIDDEAEETDADSDELEGDEIEYDDSEDEEASDSGDDGLQAASRKNTKLSYREDERAF